MQLGPFCQSPEKFYFCLGTRPIIVQIISIWMVSARRVLEYKIFEIFWIRLSSARKQTAEMDVFYFLANSRIHNISNILDSSTLRAETIQIEIIWGFWNCVPALLQSSSCTFNKSLWIYLDFVTLQEDFIVRQGPGRQAGLFNCSFLISNLVFYSVF